jgi:phenylacetate-CoA ligase
MSRFYDVLETRLPAEREQELLTALQVQLSHVKAHTSWGPLLQDVTPQNILTPDDMSDIPVLRKSDLKALQDKQKPFGGLVAAKWPQIKYVFSSPGPIYEPESYRADYFRSARALYAAGFRAGDIVHNCFSYHLTPAGRMFDSGAHALGCAVIPAGVGQTELQVVTIHDVQPNGYVGTPSFLKMIIEKAEEMAVDVSCIKRALVTGEALPPSLRAWFQDRGIATFQCYGTAELGIVAYESDALEGMIVNEGIIVELVNPGTGEPVAAGEVGEILVTTLNADYPLIRFATGDLSAFMSTESPCGRTGKRIVGWMGRADQSAKVRGMFVHPHQVGAIVGRFPSISAARMVVETLDHADQMALHIETTETGDAFAAQVTTAIRDLCKVRGDVVMVAPGALPKDGIVIDDQRTYE